MKIPHSVEGGEEGLVRALVDQWPACLSFVTSYCTILIMWGNHHEVPATACAFFSPFITIAICTSLWVFWAVTMQRERHEMHSPENGPHPIMGKNITPEDIG